MNLINIYGKQISVIEKEYPYNRRHPEILMFSKQLILEFDNGEFDLIHLDNKKVEYSLEILKVNNDNLFTFNKNSLIVFPLIDSILKYEIIRIEYLHIINNHEVHIDENDYSEKLFYSRIGVKYSFSNGAILHIYSAEPEKDNTNNQYKIFRPASVISMIVLDNKGRGTIEMDNDTNTFCSTYREKVV